MYLKGDSKAGKLRLQLNVNTSMSERLCSKDQRLWDKDPKAMHQGFNGNTHVYHTS